MTSFGETGELVLAAVPIGNQGDASPRLIEALRDAHIIACEDTRKLQRLLNDLGVSTKAKFESYHDASEKPKAKKLLQALMDGARVVLITDAGTPLISDPGYEITRLAIEADVMVCVLPGPSAVLAALSVSGLPPDRFVFEGFLPKKSGGRKNRLLELASENRTVVFYESARRVERTLTEMVDIFGGARRACIARELTKLHEEVLRGSLDELIEELHGRVLKGEVTLVVEGVTRKGRHQREKNRIQ